MDRMCLWVCVLALVVGSRGAPSPQPLDVDDFAEKRALFIVAHPDDTAGLAGGLVSLLTSNGCEVHVLVTTNGDKVQKYTV